jgi:hypothetical protein
VPRSFATRHYPLQCADNDLACYAHDLAFGDGYSTKVAGEMAQWAAVDKRIAAIVPWNWLGCAGCNTTKDEVGTVELPRTAAAWKAIGGAIKKNASTSSCVHADGSALASCFGFNSSDSTAILQKALASGASLLTIDSGQPQQQSLPWIVTPLFLENVTNLIVVIEPGVTILAKEGAFHGGGDCLLLLRNCRNVTLRGGVSVAAADGPTPPPRGTLKMRRADYADPAKYTKAEWRMAVRVDETASDITISNVRHAPSPVTTFTSAIGQLTLI